MEKHYFFDRNLLALSVHNDALCKRFSAAETTLGRYRFVEGKQHQHIPAWVDKTGAAHILHSLVAPEREAEKLAACLENEGYIVIFGLGAGFLAEAVLGHQNVQKVVVIDYDINSVAELLCSREYIHLFGDERFKLLVDYDKAGIEQYITETYYPCMHNGIRLFPLRARCDFDQEHFLDAAEAVRCAIDNVSSDYSVQAHFGKRWFSNIIRNIWTAETQHEVIAPVTRAAVCAAGPSLDAQLESLKQKHSDIFIIATDTSLGALTGAGIKPDAVISIDCQHISYLHFMTLYKNSMDDTTLFLDLASPPMLARSIKKSFFFSGGHPLVRYISIYFKQFFYLDTSGANVTYAGVSLAEMLGAKTIELYGADFAYPEGMLYTRGAYFYPYLRKRQNRFMPAESQLADFIFKIPSLEKIQRNNSYYYETRSLKMYRKRLEEKATLSNAAIENIQGMGAPVCIETKKLNARQDNTIKLLSGGRAQSSAKEFLLAYKNKIEALPLPDAGIEQYSMSLSPEEHSVWITLLPSAAAVKQHDTKISSRELLACVKSECAKEIEQVLKSHL